VQGVIWIAIESMQLGADLRKIGTGKVKSKGRSPEKGKKGRQSQRDEPQRLFEGTENLTEEAEEKMSQRGGEMAKTRVRRTSSHEKKLRENGQQIPKKEGKKNTVKSRVGTLIGRLLRKLMVEGE